MDSVTKLQGKLTEANNLLQYVLKELDGYAENGGKNKVNFSEMKLRGDQYRFYEHPLKNCDFQDEYMTLLVSLLVSGGKEEEGWTILYQIATGANYKNDLPSLVKDARTLTEERFAEILRMITSCNLSRTFAIDSLLLCHRMGVDDAQVTLLAGIYELLKLEKDFLEEAISFVQVLDSSLWGNYARKAKNWKLLTAKDIATYIGGIAANSFENISKIKHPRIIISGIYYNDTSMLRINDWQTSGILFMRCIFDKIGGIYSHDKDVMFVDCIFNKNTEKYKDSDRYRYMADYQWTDKDYESNKYRAFFDLMNVKFIRCALNDFNDSIPMMALNYGEIIQCNICNCRQNSVSSNLINIHNSKIFYSRIDQCANSVSYRYAPSESGVGCVLYANDSLLYDVNFNKCESFVDNSNIDQYAHIVILDQKTVIENCHFGNNHCSVSSYDYHGKNKQILSMRNSQEINNDGLESINKQAKIPNTLLPKYNSFFKW